MNSPLILQRVRLENGDELLHRQILPNHWTDGRLSTSIFGTQQPSVDRGSMTTGELAFERARLAKLPTLGFCSVTVGECETAGREKGPSCSVCVYEDPITHDEETNEEFAHDDPRRNPSHAIIEFDHLKRGQLSRISKELWRLAEPRVKLLLQI